MCPECGTKMQIRKFIDSWDPNGSPEDVTKDFWCPRCRLRWMALEMEPSE